MGILMATTFHSFCTVAHAACICETFFVNKN